MDGLPLEFDWLQISVTACPLQAPVYKAGKKQIE